MMTQQQIWKMNCDVQMEDILNYLGCETRQQGSRISFLCPFHGDEHFGSCFIMKNAPSYGYCFVCGRKITGLDMLQELSGLDKNSCLVLLANLSNHPEYLQELKQNHTDYTPSPLERLTERQLDLIGLKHIPKSVKTLVSINEKPSNYQIHSVPISTNDSLQYYYQPNFAKDLERNCPEAIENLIQQKCLEKLIYIEQLRQGIDAPMSSELSRWEWSLIQRQLLTVHDWHILLDALQNEIETIYYDVGGTFG